ncbi:RsiV family protein [Flavonifractor plautii]|nr:RsiV family protein [Flavonifractor plautii]
MGAGGGGAAAPGSAVRGESWFAPDWEARLPRSFDPERFYLTEAGPVIYFPLYSIAPYAEGFRPFLSQSRGRKKIPRRNSCFLHFLPCQPCRRGVIIKGVPGETPS